MATMNVRTAHGTIHRKTIGRTYRGHGHLYTNGDDCAAGKADCGALVSTAATITDAEVTCARCIASLR